MRERSIGERLGEALEASSAASSDLADRISVEPTVLRRWVAGEELPEEAMLHALAEALDVDPIWLETGEGTGPHSDEGKERHEYAERAAWGFRPEPADGGRDFGNANIWAFDPKLDIFIREVGQNILDVVRGRSAQARFRLILLEGERLKTFLHALQWVDLAGHLAESAKGGQKFGAVLSRGLARLQDDQQLLVLRIEEHGTTGLTGAETGSGSNFAALCRNNLDSQKSAGAGGAYGLGKAVLWRTSSLSTVLFNSDLATPHGGRTEGRLIGRSELSFHEVDDHGFAGPGWFGQTEGAVTTSYWGNRTLARDLLLDRAHGRSGTSTMVLGFHDPTSEGELEPEQLSEQLISAVGEHFWPAISRGRIEFVMEVADGGLPTDVRKTVAVDPDEAMPEFADIWRKYSDGKLVDSLEAEGDVCLRRVRLSVPSAKDGSHGRVEHDAVLLIRRAADEPGDGSTPPNRVAFFRNTGMVVRYRDLSNIRVGARPFHAAVLCGEAAGSTPADTAAEEFLRTAEPPSHADWYRTEDLANRYARGSGVALDNFINGVRKEIGDAVAPAARDLSDGPQGLKKLLRVTSRTERVAGPRLTKVRVKLVEEKWSVSADLVVPAGPGSVWSGKPLVIFGAETGGGRPVLWETLDAVEGCSVVDGNKLVVDAGRDTARFTGVTDPASHPIPAKDAAVSVEFRSAESTTADEAAA